ncbi:MAG TPA: CpsD/CapB family tyrosine-protein kinase [Steroidobacteraceae bacterium]|nr:CpsD/CapB family tyrosine-protein kinase [Steroidobacteraceae bacterium]
MSDDRLRSREERPRKRSVVESRPSASFPITGLEPSVGICRSNRVLLPKLGAPSDDRADSAYRMLRTRLLHRLAQRSWSMLGVTSPVPADGKTLTTINLALSIAREASATPIIIDLDLRNPSVCRTLGVEPRRTVLDYFEGGAAAHEVFFSIGVDNLVCAGNVRRSDHASELLGTRRLQDLLDCARSIAPNPVLLVDLSPVLSTDEALIVAPVLDALLMVVSEGATPRPSLERATDLIAEFPLVGYVLNRSREAERSYHYGYYGNK